MAVPRPAHAGPDRSRASEPGGYLGDDRRASARLPPEAGGAAVVPHRPDRPGHVHSPARMLGPGLPGARRRRLPAPDGPAVDPWSGPRDGHTGRMSAPGP